MTTMIQANDLRIGNFVLNSKGEITEVYSIDEYGINSVRNPNDSLDIYVEEFNHIPLTEEWMLKLGFESYGAWFYKNALLIIEAGLSKPIFSVSIRTTDDSSKYLRHIEYVHQLHNLYYALTGQELTISSDWDNLPFKD